MYHKDQWIAQHERAVDGFACGDLTYAQAVVELLELGFTDDEAHAELEAVCED